MFFFYTSSRSRDYFYNCPTTEADMRHNKGNRHLAELSGEGYADQYIIIILLYIQEERARGMRTLTFTWGNMWRYSSSRLLGERRGYMQVWQALEVGSVCLRAITTAWKRHKVLQGSQAKDGIPFASSVDDSSRLSWTRLVKIPKDSQFNFDFITDELWLYLDF